MKATSAHVKVADEVFIATALLHREHPNRPDFTINEIVERAKLENLNGELLPGVTVHASLHCVANKPPNPSKIRMLYATGKSTRRLLLSGDDIHPERKGKTFPSAEDVPPKYGELIDWAKRRFETGSGQPTRWLDGIFKMRGMGRELWRGEDPDEYIRRLRENWE